MHVEHDPGNCFLVCYQTHTNTFQNIGVITCRCLNNSKNMSNRIEVIAFACVQNSTTSVKQDCGNRCCPSQQYNKPTAMPSSTCRGSVTSSQLLVSLSPKSCGGERLNRKTLNPCVTLPICLLGKLCIDSMVSRSECHERGQLQCFSRQAM